MKRETAAARTLNIPSVDVSPQNKAADTPIDTGPAVIALPFRVPGQAYPATHYALRAGDPEPLCGATHRGVPPHSSPGKVCMSCRVAASRIRAVVR